MKNLITFIGWLLVVAMLGTFASCKDEPVPAHPEEVEPIFPDDNDTVYWSYRTALPVVAFHDTVFDCTALRLANAGRFKKAFWTYFDAENVVFMPIKDGQSYDVAPGDSLYIRLNSIITEQQHYIPQTKTSYWRATIITLDSRSGSDEEDE